MAFSMKNAKAVLNTTAADVYTCPVGASAVVFSMTVTNVSGRSDTVEIIWTDASNGSAPTRLAFNTPIPKGESINISGKHVLEAGDKIRGVCGVVNALEISLSLMEIV